MNDSLIRPNKKIHQIHNKSKGKRKSSQDEKESKYGKLNEMHGKPNREQTDKMTDKTEWAHKDASKKKK